MSLPVRLRSPAQRDIVAHIVFLQKKGVEVAIRFVDAFEISISRIGRSPEIGGERRFENPLLDRWRVWPIGGFRNFLIFYRVLSTEIEVVRVIHGAQDLGTIFGADAE